jgi:hypothetical protein
VHAYRSINHSFLIQAVIIDRFNNPTP